MIVSAAILHKGKIITGKRHSECIRKIIMEEGETYLSTDIQGFVTDNGEFVDRRQAYEIALAYNQIKPGKFPMSPILYSEDLW